MTGDDAAEWGEVAGRFDLNLARVAKLAHGSEALRPLLPGAGTALADDMLRSAVVLLHATLEDLLQSVAEVRLRAASPEQLKDVPFWGTFRPGKLASRSRSSRPTATKPLRR